MHEQYFVLLQVATKPRDPSHTNWHGPMFHLRSPGILYWSLSETSLSKLLDVAIPTPPFMSVSYFAGIPILSFPGWGCGKVLRVAWMHVLILFEHFPKIEFKNWLELKLKKLCRQVPKMHWITWETFAATSTGTLNGSSVFYVDILFPTYEYYSKPSQSYIAYCWYIITNNFTVIKCKYLYRPKVWRTNGTRRLSNICEPLWTWVLTILNNSIMVLFLRDPHRRKALMLFFS